MKSAELEVESWYMCFDRGIITTFADPVNHVLAIPYLQFTGLAKALWDHIFSEEK